MISIIIHATGDPDLACETIRRATCTAADNPQVIVVGAVDDLRARMRSCQPGSELTWVAGPRLNRAAAVNEGLRVAHGEMISTLSTGEFHFDDTLCIVAEAARQHLFTDCFYGDAMLTDAAGKPVAEFNASARPERAQRPRLRLCPAAVFIRRHALDRIGPLDASLHAWADYELWLRLARAGATFTHLPRLLASRPTSAEDPAPSDFAVIPSRHSLDELMRVRLASGAWPLSASMVAWYGVTRALASAPATRSRGSLRTALHHAWEAQRRFGSGRQAWLLNQPTTAVIVLAASTAGKFLSEFQVKVRNPMKLRRFQAVRSKIFRLRHHAPRPLSTPRHYARSRVLLSPPSISIVTPSFNQGHVLEQTIRSVLDQGYPALEYVVQDGGSTDSSVDILRRYAPQLSSWDSAPDGGQAAAINLGMRRTSGEIMAYLNSDDMLLPGSLAYVAEYFQNHPEVDVVYGHRILIDEDGREIGRWVLPPHDDHAIAFSDFIPQETLFWRRRAWDRIGAHIDESLRFALDWDLILRFREAGLVFRRLPRFIGAFRVWPDQKSLSSWLPWGRRESERLTARTLGSTPSRSTTRREIRRYVRHHWLCDKLYQAGMLRY